MRTLLKLKDGKILEVDEVMMIDPKMKMLGMFIVNVLKNLIKLPLPITKKHSEYVAIVDTNGNVSLYVAAKTLMAHAIPGESSLLVIYEKGCIDSSEIRLKFINFLDNYFYENALWSVAELNARIGS